ncbi:hypothetical protein NESM_000768200 [Novymonas esmeraldas]|uniref:Uncharacterized protein n=1 Tax=Novymonas esmeraldas TaxID=1808958 RepID=A0AAW0EVF7_9TRYP
MKQINVETATREQLVDFIRRMHPQLLREQERVRELESQIRGLQAFVHEKNAEIRELRQQSDRLTEKSASDEETIGALIRQMEEMRSEQAPASGTASLGGAAGAERGRAVEHGNGKPHSSDGATGGDTALETLRLTDAVGGGEAGRRHARTPPPHRDSTEGALAQLKSQHAAAVATIAGKTEEIITLESKVGELTEVNAFYSAIVLQHDQEEKVRLSQALAYQVGHSDDDIASLRQEVDRLQLQISTAEGHGEALQRIIKAVEVEKAALREENQLLKRESVLLEAEMEEMTREHARARSSLAAAAAAAVAPARQSTSPERPTVLAADAPPHHGVGWSSPSRGPPQASDASSPQLDRRVSSLPTGSTTRVSPLARDGRLGVVGGGSVVSSEAASMAAARSQSRFTFRSLRPMRVRNPDAQEKELLDRIRLYEEQFAQMEAFEADRQRSFDEMERNRAELFVSMNGQLEKQRREIHKLRKLHDEASLNSSATARPSRTHSVISVAAREEDDVRGRSRRRGSHSPVERCLTAVPTSSQSLPINDSTDVLDGAEWVNEREGAIPRDGPRPQPTFTASSVCYGLLHETVWLEREARLRIREEALEDELRLMGSMLAGIVRLWAELQESREAEFVDRSSQLVRDVGALQARVVDLEAQLVSVEKEKGAASASGEASVPPASSPGLWEGKIAATALIALEAYNSVLVHHAELLESCQRGTLDGEGVPTAEGSYTDPDLSRDLERVRSALGAARLASQPWPTPCHAEAVDRGDVSTALGRGRGSREASRTDTAAAEDEHAEVEVVIAAEPVGSAATASQLLPQPACLEGSLASSHSDNSEEEADAVRTHGAAVLADATETTSCGPTSVFSQEPAAAHAGRSATGSVDDGAHEGSGSENTGPGGVPTQHVDAEHALLPLPQTASDDGVAPAPDDMAVDDEEAAGSTLVASDGDDTTAADSVRTSPARAEKTAPVIRSATPSSPAESVESVSQGEQEAPSSVGGGQSAASTSLAVSRASICGSEEGEGEVEARAQDAGPVGEESAAARDGASLSDTAELEVSGGEEAEFLAELEREMAKGGVETLAEAREDGDGTSVASGDAGTDGDCGEACVMEVGKGQGGDTDAAAGGAVSTASVSLSSSGTAGGRLSSHAAPAEAVEELDSVIEGELDETPPSTKPSEGETDRRSAASSHSPPNGATADEPLSSSSSVSFHETLCSSSSVSYHETHSHTVEGEPGERCAGPCEAPASWVASPTPPIPLTTLGQGPGPVSLDALFGAAEVAAHLPPPTRHSGGGQTALPASPAPWTASSLSDPHTSTSFGAFGAAAPRPTTSPNSVFVAHQPQTPPRSYFSLSPTGGPRSQPPSGGKGPHLRASSSSSSSDFEAGFDPFA